MILDYYVFALSQICHFSEVIGIISCTSIPTENISHLLMLSLLFGMGITDLYRTELSPKFVSRLDADRNNYAWCMGCR